MATSPDFPEATLDRRAQTAPPGTTRQEIRFAHRTIVTTALGAGAAVFAAGAAFAKLAIG